MYAITFPTIIWPKAPTLSEVIMSRIPLINLKMNESNSVFPSQGLTQNFIGGGGEFFLKESRSEACRKSHNIFVAIP